MVIMPIRSDGRRVWTHHVLCRGTPRYSYERMKRDSILTLGGARLLSLCAELSKPWLFTH